MRVLDLVLVATLLPTTCSAQCPALIWNDEFEGDSLNASKWTHMVGNGCDMGEGMCGWGNNEWEVYTAGTENIQVSNGTLKIYAKYDSASDKYTSARIRTLGKADFDLKKPTRIEARIKVPKNSQGLWPAFWMMPSQIDIKKWPLGGEIDIMEFIGKEPNSTYGVMHYGHKWNDKSQKGGLVKFPEHAGEQFHIFALEKTNNAMTWFLDGKQYQQFTSLDIEPKFEWPFEAVFHFILNLAIGGNWPDYPDDTTQFPNQLEVDYVRVFDLNSSSQLPQIQGDTLVRTQAQNVQYCISVGSLEPHTDYDANLEWTVPPLATTYSADDTPANCILVNFGTQSGFVGAKVFFSCGRWHEFQLPVEVQDYYGAEFAFIVPDGNLDQASFDLSTGNYTVEEAKGFVPATIIYQRNPLELYDHIIFGTRAIPNPSLYVQSAKKFYLNALSHLNTAALCTRFWIQLEDSSIATPSNYPLGRHSRYVSFLDKADDWQRMEFDFYDTPDRTSQTVDRIVLLIDDFVERADIYHLRNLESALAGCDPSNGDDFCEPLSENACQAAAKSEAGACTDGHNNDGKGWNGDGPMDCEDSDCWGLDPACLETTISLAMISSTGEICYDGIDNDGNGLVDCEDTACGDSVACGSWSQPQCSAYLACEEEGHVGDCCPTPLGEYRECCTNDTPVSCSVHPECAKLRLEGDCCGTGENGSTFASCCAPNLCASNPRCSGLEGACCPADDGSFHECCEVRPVTCRIHPKCAALELAGDCCPTANGLFLDCCEPSECAAHPACSGIEGSCCPNQAGIYSDCCNLDLPVFAGFTGRVVQAQLLEAAPATLGWEEVESYAVVSSSAACRSLTRGLFQVIFAILLVV